MNRSIELSARLEAIAGNNLLPQFSVCSMAKSSTAGNDGTRRNGRQVKVMSWRSYFGFALGALLYTSGPVDVQGVARSRSAIQPSELILVDTFAGPDTVITNYTYYQTAPFPYGGTSLPNNPSQNWETGSGYLHRENGWGYSGRPDAWHDKYFFAPIYAISIFRTP